MDYGQPRVGGFHFTFPSRRDSILGGGWLEQQRVGYQQPWPRRTNLLTLANRQLGKSLSKALLRIII